mmetsp:Transcript_37433/g.98165  ORF Transcript_37433/g.98165 Transcript_37433/m.98165 type:complete len:259 (+) Transcript_37433:71-847(+)
MKESRRADGREAGLKSVEKEESRGSSSSSADRDAETSLVRCDSPGLNGRGSTRIKGAVVGECQGADGGGAIICCALQRELENTFVPHAHHAVARTHKEFAVPIEGEGGDTVVLADSQCANVTTVFDGPQPDSAIGRTGVEGSAGGVDGQGVHTVVVTLERHDVIAVGRPLSNGGVGSGGEERSGGRHGECKDAPSVAFERPHVLARCGIPHPDRLVVRARVQCAISPGCYDPNVVVMASQGAKRLAIRPTPCPEGVIR